MVAAEALARVVLIANQKGGVGKTSLTTGIASMVAAAGRRVLVVDADQQGNASRNNLGVEGDNGRSLSMALQFAHPLEPVRDVRPGLDVLPGGALLATMSGVVLSAERSGIDVLGNFRTTLGELCARERYDLAIIDTGPGDAPLLDIMLQTARYLIVPSRDDEASFDGADALAQRYMNARQRGSTIELLGMVLFDANLRATARNRQAFEALRELLDNSGSVPFETIIRSDDAAAIDMRQRHLTPAEAGIGRG